MKALKKRMIALTLIMCLCFTMQVVPVSAAEPAENDISVMSIEDAGITREEALECLDVTEKEAQDMKLYAITATNHVTLSRGETWTPSAFTFKGENVGSYFTVNASKLKFGAVWQPTGNGGYAVETRILLFAYNSSIAKGQLFFSSEDLDSNGKASQTSDWISTTYGLDYMFKYDCYFTGSAAKQGKCTITMVVGVV